MPLTWTTLSPLLLLFSLVSPAVPSGTCSGNASSCQTPTWPLSCGYAAKPMDAAASQDLGNGRLGRRSEGHVVLLDSWEKLTWAKLGLVRLLRMTKEAGLSLVEPCVGGGGIGGFGEAGKLQLDAYFDTSALHILGHTATVSEFSGVAERLRDGQWVFDELIVFLWWQEELGRVSFDPASGVTDCTGTVSDILNASVVPITLEGASPPLYQVSQLDDGTGNAVWTEGMTFRRILCADPGSLSRPGTAFGTAGEWLANAQGGGGRNVALARYRRIALARKGEDEWGMWPGDEEGLGALRLAPQLKAAVEDFRKDSLGGGGRYLGVHMRGGRVWNKAGVEGGRYVRQRHTDDCVGRLMLQTVECAEILAARAEATRASLGLGGVYVASDLREADMPEMQTPAMDPPYVTAEERRGLLEVFGDARAVLSDGLGGVTFPSDALPDPIGMGALIDAELLAGAAVFLHAGQPSGLCEPTGYGESIVRSRRERGLENTTSEYVAECCVPGC